MMISVVTASYNQAQFLEETIKSVIDQGYPKLEYIVIDGGSSDRSQEIIRKYEDYLHYWVSEPDKGHGDALNKGFQKTTGEIMAWINSDDKYMPWTFSAVSEIFSKFPHVNWIVGTNGVWDSKGRMSYAHTIHKNIYDFLLGRFMWIQQESVFWRRSVWNEAGATIDESYRFMVDGDLWCRFFLHNDLYHVRCVLGGYRIHETNRARLNHDECLKEMAQAIDRMRRQCDDRVLQDFRALRTLRSLQSCVGGRVSTLLFRRVFPELYERAKYEVIRFDGTSWNEERSEFSLLG